MKPLPSPPSLPRVGTAARPTRRLPSQLTLRRAAVAPLGLRPLVDDVRAATPDWPPATMAGCEYYLG